MVDPFSLNNSHSKDFSNNHLVNTEILIGQCKYIIMNNTLSILHDVFLDDDNYFQISELVKGNPDKFERDFLEQAIDFYEKHKNDIKSTV